MNELRAIINAFDQFQTQGERCALATVVSVEGSAYRRPGARMLVCESGATVGTISAGCLERDIMEHAQRVIKAAQPKLVEYDTSSTSEEIVWGLGLGCNGIVRVLVEPITPRSIHLAALRAALKAQSSTGIATLFHHSSSIPAAAPIKIGSRLVIDEAGEARCEIPDGKLASMIEDDLRTALRNETSGARVYETEGDTTKVFVETVAPPVTLIVFGAGHDALPIIDLARGLGWQTEIVDPQERPDSRTRFAQAEKVILARPETIREHVTITPRTLTLVMAHNYTQDQALLRFLLASPARYIGVMGPRKRTEKMLQEMAADGDTVFRFMEQDEARLYSPVGLDIGAITPPEIALSIIAEMRAVIARHEVGHLRSRHPRIHGTKGTPHLPNPEPASLVNSI
jgi:xanthine dehydrogenase accessory factor